MATAFSGSPFLVSWCTWGVFVAFLVSLAAMLWIYADAHRRMVDATVWKSLAAVAAVLTIPAMLASIHNGFALEMENALNVLALLSMLGLLLGVGSAFGHLSNIQQAGTPEPYDWSSSQPTAPVEQAPTRARYEEPMPAPPRRHTVMYEEDQQQSGLAAFVVVGGPYHGTRFEIKSGPDDVTRIGGDPEMNDYFLDDDHVSGLHLSVRHRDGAYTVSDLESRTGTFVNGQPITGATLLKDKDRVRIGRTDLAFTDMLGGGAPSPSALTASRSETAIDGLRAVEPATITGAFKAEPAFERQESGAQSELREDRIDPNVQFTLYRPGVVRPERWYELLAFAHLTERRPDVPGREPDPISDPVQEVAKQAKQILGPSMSDYKDLTQDSRQPVPEGGELSFVLEAPGIDFNPTSVTLRWHESVHRAEFRMRAPAALDGTTPRGRMSVYLDGVLISEISLAFKVDSSEPEGSQPPLEPLHGRAYHRIFASYSYKDVAVVSAVENYAQTLGAKFIRDLVPLRAGEVWSESIGKLIEQADVFQLFWSTNAMRSEFVRHEYEHALSLAKPDFIRPVYWEEPLPSAPDEHLPPESLLRLRFRRIPSGTAVPRESIQPGTTLQRGNYIIASELGRGGFGAVYLAHQPRLGRDIAVKVLHPERCGDAEVVERFRREALAAAGLSHPNVLPVIDFDYDREAGLWFLATQYVHGARSLASLLPPLAPEVVAPIIAGVANALDAAHAHGIVHRDVKPENVLLERDRPLLTDFGIAHLVSAPGMTGPGVAIGTPAYMSPEQALGRTVGPASDQYSLAVMTYYLLTGRVPFAGSAAAMLHEHVHETAVPAHEVNTAVPLAISDVLARAMSKSADSRFPSCADFASALADTASSAASIPVETQPAAAPRIPSATTVGVASSGLPADRLSDFAPQPDAAPGAASPAGSSVGRKPRSESARPSHWPNRAGPRRWSFVVAVAAAVGMLVIVTSSILLPIRNASSPPPVSPTASAAAQPTLPAFFPQEDQPPLAVPPPGSAQPPFSATATRAADSDVGALPSDVCPADSLARTSTIQEEDGPEQTEQLCEEAPAPTGATP